MTEALLWLTSIALVVLGIAGTVLPALPGAPLVFAGLLLNSWIYNFEKVGAATLTILGILAVVTLVIDVAASALGAKRAGASTSAVLGAALGSFLGIFAGIAGIILGPFIGALLGELYARRDILAAGKVGLATWLGILLGTVAKLAVIFSMLGIFIAAFLIP